MHNPMKKDRLIVLTDAVLAIIMTILVLELENQQHQVLKLLGFTAKFLCLFSFPFWLGSLDGTKHIMGKG